jgi:ATP:ADP antiporter, AAA family
VAREPEDQVARVTAQAGDGGAAYRLLRRAVAVEPLRACLYFFFTLSSYFILRPIRDAMGVAAGVSGLPWLFAGTLAAMLLANPIYSALVAKYPVKRFIGITYLFFAANLGLFFLAHRAGTNEVWLGRVFLVWTSVFNLFVVSVFWSFMADTFTQVQARRLFGFIGVGGTLGSIAGSAVTASLVRTVGTNALLLVSAGLLLIATVIVTTFPTPASGGGAARPRTPIGGSIWAGITGVARSSYLSGIAGFLLLYTFGSTVLYFAQAAIIGEHFPTREARTEALAGMEVAAQTLTVLTQVFLTGRVIAAIGLVATLCTVPLLSVLGFAALGGGAVGLVPILPTFIAVSVLRRATNFALTNPAMEVLFTVVTREDKYKAKSFIETFVYRAGDQLSAWGYAGLTVLGLGLGGIAWVSVPVSAVFLGLGIWVGRRQGELARERAPR